MQINTQFVSRGIVGAVSPALLVLSSAWQRIQETSEFAGQNIRLFFAAIDDVEAVHKYYGFPCQEQGLSYLMLMKRYGYEVDRSGGN